MSDPALPLQEAIENALRGSADLKDAMGLTAVRLYTMTAPNEAPFPYLIIGEDQVLDDSTECVESSEVITTVHVFSRVKEGVATSRQEAKRIAGLVRSILKGLPSVEGFDIVLADFESARHLTDEDGLTAHAVISHRFLLDPA